MEFKKVLVPITNIRADEEAVELACKIAKKSKGDIYVVHIIQVKRSLPLDSPDAEIEAEIGEGEEMLRHAESVADDQDYEVETELLQAREVGPAIVNEVVGHNVDLVIIGLEYKECFGQFSIGDTIPYVLKNAPCHVLIYREKSREKN